MCAYPLYKVCFGFITPAIIAGSIALGWLDGSVDAAADAVALEFVSPSIDRWNYPFNPSPGTRPAASVFTARPESGFDDRDAQALVIFNTSSTVLPGLGDSAYDIDEVTLTVMVERNNSFAYDPTVDPWQSWLEPESSQYIPDPDPSARPVVLFGVGFRNGWMLENYVENSAFCAGCDCFTSCVEVRNTYPVDFDAAGSPRDVSNNVRDEFDPRPFAVGAINGLTPGTLVPTRTNIVFAIDVNDPHVQCYVRDGLNRGRLAFMISSMHETAMLGSDGYPTFYMKENVNVPSTAQPARLVLTVTVTPGSGIAGDITGDSIVNVLDLFKLLSEWGSCPCCAEDFNNTGDVDVADLFYLLAHWTS